jgi:hypothetical protein
MNKYFLFCKSQNRKWKIEKVKRLEINFVFTFEMELIPELPPLSEMPYGIFPAEHQEQIRNKLVNQCTDETEVEIDTAVGPEELFPLLPANSNNFYAGVTWCWRVFRKFHPQCVAKYGVLSPTLEVWEAAKTTSLYKFLEPIFVQFIDSGDIILTLVVSRPFELENLLITKLKDPNCPFSSVSIHSKPSDILTRHGPEAAEKWAATLAENKAKWAEICAEQSIDPSWKCINCKVVADKELLGLRNLALGMLKELFPPRDQ